MTKQKLNINDFHKKAVSLRKQADCLDKFADILKPFSYEKRKIIIRAVSALYGM